MRREWLIALAVAILTSLLLQTPYALGHILARPGTEYVGLLINVEDFSYHAIMLQGYDGAWLYHIRFTPEPHAPAFLYAFYLALGHLARGLGISIVAMWHAARIVAALALFLTTFGFITFFLGGSYARRIAYLLAIFTAGFDWTFFPWEQSEVASGAPVDFRMPEARLFFSALTFPHVAIGTVLILTVFWLMLRALEGREWRGALIAGSLNLAIGIIYPFLIYLVVGVLGVYWLVSSLRSRRILLRKAVYLALAFAIPAPLFFYYAYVLQTNEVFRIWNVQAATLSPNPLHYVLAYGALLGLGAFALRNSARHSLRNSDFLWVWIVVAAVLLYAPIESQRRFVQGLQVPLAILASAGVITVVIPAVERSRAFRELASRPRYSALGLRRLLLAMLLFLLGVANGVILLRLSFVTAIDQPDVFFRSQAERDAVDWLRGHTARDEIVLGDYWTGSFIPARAGNAVFVGQRYETFHFNEKLAQVEKFFQTDNDDAWRRDLLARHQIAFVFVGPRERDLGTFDPRRLNLELAYRNEQVEIYRVKGSR